ncbi:hypothetical protein F5146DRAFT_1004044 [Armillaria mellea]|nr:hypothetical protein F5146DRAFT_1004044 [Armillaria mellea]
MSSWVEPYLDLITSLKEFSLWDTKQTKREWHICVLVSMSLGNILILLCVLWGLSALRTKKFQMKTTYGRLWEVKEVTPAAIVFAAITANLKENSEEEEILRGLDEVEAEAYLDNEDFHFTTDIVAAAPVRLVVPQVKATKGKGGRKKVNTSKEAPVHQSAQGQGPKAQSNIKQPLPVEKERSTRARARSGSKDATQAAMTKVEVDQHDKASKNNDDDDGDSDGNGLGDIEEEEEEEEEEEDLEYPH